MHNSLHEFTDDESMMRDTGIFLLLLQLSVGSGASQLPVWQPLIVLDLNVFSFCTILLLFLISITMQFSVVLFYW